MQLLYTVAEPVKFLQEQRELFLELLIEQGQVENPTIEKVNNCRFLCIVYYNGAAIGIGAIKRSGKSAFRKSGMEELAEQYNNELGYLYVRDEKPYKDFGIGRTISRLLLQQVEGENVFASTAVDKDASTMVHILSKLGFKQEGKPYEGGKTNKAISLFIRSQ
jgi:hypothetical protein